MAHPQAPSNLSARAKRFWDETTEKYDMGGHELLLLEQVCRTMDDIRTLENGMRKALTHDGDGLMVLGAARQRVANPLIGELRQARQSLRQLIGALKLPDEDEGSAEDLATKRTRGARAAAEGRWGVGTGT
jgi:hypothetical protein